MTSVLISIQPKWCELITKGEKTIEVRKTRPKIETPFKCYIYCTGGYAPPDSNVFGRGWRKSVIGEFICDEIIEYPYMTDGYSSSYGYLNITRDGLIMMRLKYSELETYGDGKTIYGWHISDLKIYDEPKELCEFKHCGVNYHFDPVIKRPPQSWCYCEPITVYKRRSKNEQIH